MNKEDFELTIDNIIIMLNKNGINSKKLVVNRLVNANKKDLVVLKRSIQEKIIALAGDKNE